tara:strand:+ start:706 stop:984 length:279 start_codon:yes stop_codon:yes gene_type:complete
MLTPDKDEDYMEAWRRKKLKPKDLTTFYGVYSNETKNYVYNGDDPFKKLVQDESEGTATNSKRNLQIEYVPAERFSQNEIIERDIDPTTVNW